jgi:photosystem II stability/assembly factor-like uncharacterized protein
MMPHSLSLAASATGLAAALILACSDTSDPSVPSSVTEASTVAGPTLTPQHSGTTNRLQAVSPVNASVVWASGVGGTFTVTTNGGRTWRAGVVSGADELQFRDVEGVSADVAYLLASGPGKASRIYKTTDGGRHWTIQFRNTRPNGFYDCFAFWTPNRGITMADALFNRFPVIRTTDGKTWQSIAGRMPPAQDGEAAFAASGTCVATKGSQLAWIGTGGAKKARILRTGDGGNNWEAFETPIVQGTGTSGIFSVEFRDAQNGILAGGDLEDSGHTPNVAVSSDGGRHWKLATGTPFPGAAYGLSYAHGSRPRTVVATGPGGAAWSDDEGESWHRLPATTDFWAVAFANPSAGWLVGTEGRIVKVSF